MNKVYYIIVFDELDCTFFKFSTSTQFNEYIHKLTCGYKYEFTVATKKNYTISYIYK